MLGSVCAVDLNNVSDIENSNLIQDDNQLSYQNLEVSSNGSISDNYSYNSNIDYSNSGVIRSNYENNNVIELQQISDNGVISEAQSSLSNTTLSGHNTTLYFKNGTTYDVKLTDITGKALSNQTVSFLINGKLYNRTTGSDGVASMNINLAVGKYNITASYAGSSLYGGSSVTNLVEVLSTISANDVVKFYRNGTQYYAKFVDGNGNPLVNAEVRFNINGVFYTRNTNNDGIANLSIALNPNKYILTAIHPNGEMSANNITVLSTINSSDIIKYFRNGTQYYATFYDAMGNPLVNETVRFNINGVIYEKRTNNKGTANLTISLYPGNYILTAYHPNGESHGYNINVLSTLIDNNNITMYYRDGTAFTIKVIDGQGKPLANTTVRFNINGVFYDKVTDENGIAKLGIRLYPNNYIITSSYNGLEVSNNIGVSSSNTTIIGKDAYIIINSINSNYTVTLVDIKGNPIENQTVYFKYNNKEVTATTDENGNATITISNLEKGDYNVTYGFNGVIGYYPSKSSSILHVINSTTILTGNDVSMVYNDGSKFRVTLTDLNGKPLANKIITFLINGVAYNRTTDSNGVASIDIRLYPGNYVISYYYSNKGALDYNDGSNNVVVAKQTLNIKGNDLVMLPNDGSAFEVAITDKDKNPVKDIAVLFTVSGVTYTKYTDQSGIAKLNINLNVGYYKISYAINDTLCKGSGSNMILVNGTILAADDINMNVGTSGNFNVKLTDAKNNPINGATIKFYYNGITKTAITNSGGIATITIDSLEKGDYPIAYYYYPTIGGNYSNSGQSYIHVSGTISIANIIDASKVVKSFIESEGKLPDSVLINGESYTLAQFLYLAAIATININNGDLSDLNSKDATNPSNYTKCANLGNLVDYISVAQAIIDYVNANGKAPESISSSVGTVTFDGLVYAFARVVAFYGNNQQLPAYVAIKSIDSDSSQFVINRVNVKATESELANIDKYLQATANCQVDDPTIVALAQKLTAGLSTPTQKASAILDYVIDNIAYAGYYDTTRGAKKTLTDKRGNCCDQAHLVIALFRAADLPARYVHGTCTFSSGPIGHVWAQVLIGDTWVVADPVSSRNSLGVIKNWNINTFTFKSYYTSLPF
ncbi:MULTISPECIES: Ig-like domain-containing protein [Methanobrevibacter]|uniref:Ig-like domain-containing protein n=1 Tax=Methanobrevibacter TaxID=2172 RepID=UPI00155522AB|nr:Ig-like domain-containing protein [Methanobrevibacter smithii]